MNPKVVKIILTLLVMIGIYFLGKKFPDEMVLIIGIALIVIIGSWLVEADKEDMM